MRTGYGHMVHDYYLAKLKAMRQARRERFDALVTHEDVLAYQAEIREVIAQSFGPWPEKTPLNTRVTGSWDAGPYRIDKLIYESRPGCWVTANLYVPKDLSAPAPAVLGTCGHSEQGKAYELYHGFCQRLAQQGFVVLVYDPINQGERDQYALLEERSAVNGCVLAHNMMGKQLELLGENMATWRIWDGIRGLDYLLSLPEVDVKRVGVTGNSGGGTMSTWLWAVEPRFTMAAPSCFVTTFLANLENELPADAEQYPVGVLGGGLEMADLAIARAPAPLLLMGQKYDFFDPRGLDEAYGEVRHVYNLLGAPQESLDYYVGPRAHGYWEENQEKMVTFFAKSAGLTVRATTNLVEFDAQQLQATKSGNVVRDGATPIFELIERKAQSSGEARKPIPATDISTTLTALLRVPQERSTPHYRVLRPTQVDRQTYSRFAVETEGNIVAILWQSMAAEKVERAHTLEPGVSAYLFLPHLSAEEDLAQDRLARDIRAQHGIYALDVRGLGESIPDDELGFWHGYGMDYMFHGHGILFGESYLGRRVYDVLRAIDLLVAHGVQAVELVGRGQGAILAIMAASLHPRVTSLTLKNAPARFEDWTQVPLVDWPAANMVRGILNHLDIPDLVGAMSKPVKILEPWDARMRPLS